MTAVLDAPGTTGGGSRAAWRAGLALGAVVIVVAVLGPLVDGHDPDAIDRAVALRPPSAQHWLGTDELGRDQLARVLDGLRRSGLAALVVLTGSMLISLVVGVVAAFADGRVGAAVDAVLMRVVDVLLAVPSLVIALSVVGALGPGLGTLLVALVASAWAAHARVVRAFATRVRERPYVLAARLAGAGSLRIALGHVLPAVLPHLLVVAALRTGGIVVALAGLSFLGLGAQPPTAELGALLGAARPFLTVAPWLMIAPLVAVLALTAAATLVAEGLRGPGAAG